MEKKYNLLTTEQPTEVDIIFEKKWLACLWVYYLDFDYHSVPTLPSELYNTMAKYLRKNNILTFDAFAAQTVALREHRSLYVIKPRQRMGTKYSIPFLYMLSKHGLSRLLYAKVVISPEKKEKMENRISRVAKDYGVPVRS